MVFVIYALTRPVGPGPPLRKSMPSFGPDQDPVRKGVVEYITVRDGRRRRVREWAPARQESKYRQLGRAYCKARRRPHFCQAAQRSGS